MSEDKIHRIAFEMMRRGTSPMPMGRTPGHLSKGIRRQATNADIDEGSTEDVHMLRPAAAMALHRLTEADL